MDGIKITFEKDKNEGNIVPEYIINQTLKYVQFWGEKKQEVLLFWAGIKNEESTYVTSCIYPKAHPLYVTIDGNPCPTTNPPNPAYIQHMHEPIINLGITEAAKVISEARKRNLTIIAQVHSHEHKAYHSPIDEQNPFDTSEGFLSVVIPEYGKQHANLVKSCAIYRCGANGKFRQLSSQEIDEAIKVVENSIIL